MEYKKIGDTTWVDPMLGYFPAVRLSPSKSGEPYKGKGESRGYLIIEKDAKGNDVIDKKNIFLSLDTVLPILGKRLEDILEERQADLDKKIKNLPYKNIIDLGPMIQDEIIRASDQYGFKTTDDLTVEVILEENLELVVRVGLA